MQSQPRSLSQMPPDLHEWAQRPAGWKCSRKCSTFAAQRAAGSSRRRARSESSASSWCAQHTLRQRVRVLHADYSQHRSGHMHNNANRAWKPGGQRTRSIEGMSWRTRSSWAWRYVSPLFATAIPTQAPRSRPCESPSRPSSSAGAARAPVLPRPDVEEPLKNADRALNVLLVVVATLPGGDEAAQLDAMDFPDLGTTVEKRKDKMPPSRSKGGGGGGGGGGDRRGQPTSALQSMIEGRAGGAAGGASGGASGDRERASSAVVPAEAHLGPPPKPVAEPDEAAHKEATAEMQASIDEIEKRVVRAPCSCFRAACGVMCRSDMAAKRVSAMLTGAAASCLPAPAVETLGRS